MQIKDFRHSNNFAGFLHSWNLVIHRADFLSGGSDEKSLLAARFRRFHCVYWGSRSLRIVTSYVLLKLFPFTICCCALKSCSWQPPNGFGAILF